MWLMSTAEAIAFVALVLGMAMLGAVGWMNYRTPQTLKLGGSPKSSPRPVR